MSGGYFIGPPARRRRRRVPGALLLVALLAAGAVVAVVMARSRESTKRHGSQVVSFEVDSKLVGRRIEQKAIVPAGAGKGRPLLVLLHGRGEKPGAAFSDELLGELDLEGGHAPVVLEVGGGESSYYHDRRDGRWGAYVVREVIPTALRRFDADGGRVAIGGFSMGGFGALDIARREPGRFCVVGAHSPAIFRRASETPPGAFDDGHDFARHDVYGYARTNARAYTHERIWIDVGRTDPFRSADAQVARGLRRRAVDVTWQLRPGGHDRGYFRANVASYLRWYSDELQRCGRERSGG